MRKNKSLLIKVFSLLLLGLVFLFLLRGYEDKIYSISFVDEEDNIAIGKYLLKGEKLYSEIYTNHQPTAYILSSLVQFVSRPPNILMVIKRHREFVIFWSFAWSAYLLWTFGFYTLFFIIPYELTKFLLFGNLFFGRDFCCSSFNIPFVFAS